MKESPYRVIYKRIRNSVLFLAFVWGVYDAVTGFHPFYQDSQDWLSYVASFLGLVCFNFFTGLFLLILAALPLLLIAMLLVRIMLGKNPAGDAQELEQ